LYRDDQSDETESKEREVCGLPLSLRQESKGVLPAAAARHTCRFRNEPAQDVLRPILANPRRARRGGSSSIGFCLVLVIGGRHLFFGGHVQL
jgi:hypothetical protein